MKKLLIAYTYYRDGVQMVGRYFLETDFVLLPTGSVDTGAAITEENIDA